MLLLACLGLCAGALTTVAGMGGGLFLVVAVSLLYGPTAALAISSPALLVSNAHRALMFRADVDWAIAKRFALSAAPAAIVAGIFVGRLPPLVIQIATLVLTTFAVLRATKVVPLSPSPRVFAPVSAGIAVVSSGTGVGGFLAAPLLVSMGLTGARYVSTAALCSVVLHAARIAGYGAGGLLSSAYVGASLVLFAGLATGNFAGRSLREWLSPSTSARIELGALVVCAVLGLFGVGAR